MKIGDFITAELLDGGGDPRQGWIICRNPFRIVGQTGTRYLCEGVPILVKNPPMKTILDLVRIYLYSQNRFIHNGEVDDLLKLMGEQRKMCAKDVWHETSNIRVKNLIINATGESNE